MMTAGIVGLGLMGSALADALVDRGCTTVVWSRTAEKCRRFTEVGAKVAASIAEAAQESDVLIVCLSDHQATMDVLSSDEVGKGMLGKVLVQLSTMSDDESKDLADWAEAHGIGYLDGSILGYPDDVRNQRCMIVYSSPKQLFEKCHAVFNAMGSKPRLVGETAGISPLFDKAIYSAAYAHWMGLFHGAAMCKAMGAPLEVFVEQLTQNWDWSIQDSAFMRMVEKQDYSVVDAAMEVHAAAYSHVLPLSAKLGVSTTLPNVVTECLERAIQDGYGDSELAALTEVLAKP